MPNYLISPNINWEVASTSRVVWLGALAKEGHWRPLNFDPVKKSLISTLSEKISLRLRSYFDISRRPECSLQCHLYSTTPFAFREEISLSPSPTKDLETYQTGIESSSCAPSVIIAGFAQSAVSIVYSLLLLHPQVLPLLGSGLFQEDHSLYKPSCYRTDIDPRFAYPYPISHCCRENILFRPWCYPYIKPSSASGDVASSLSSLYRSNFISVDRDIRYVIDMEAPLVMKEDNPNMKIIFVLRHPIERLIAHFQELLILNPNLVSVVVVSSPNSHHLRILKCCWIFLLKDMGNLVFC